MHYLKSEVIAKELITKFYFKVFNGTEPGEPPRHICTKIYSLEFEYTCI